MDRLGTALSIKTVDYGQRIIAGYAAVSGNLDRVDDVIDPSAFAKTLASKKPADIAVFIGHHSSDLPVGVPVEIRVDGKGLYTETKVFDGPAGDNLLAVARGLASHGQTLGLSIGYRVPSGGAAYEKRDGKTVRRLTEIDLVEYSFAARQSIANPEALVVGMKAGQPGGQGGAMRVEQRDGSWVLLDAESDVMESFDSEAAASAALRMMQRAMSGGGGKTTEGKAEWSTAQINDLPDSSFLFVEPGGQKDEAGKTVPRSLRHFPVRDASGAIDLPHLRNALARIPQAGDWLSSSQKSRLVARARSMLDAASSGKLIDFSADDLSGAPLLLKGLGYGFVDLADAIAEEHAAMTRLGEDIKGGDVIRPELRQKLRDLAAEIERTVEWAEEVGRDGEGAAEVNRLLAQLALMEVAV